MNSPFHNLNSNDDSEEKESNRFIEKAWGSKVRLLQKTTVRLGPEHWAMIKKHAEAHIPIQDKSTKQQPESEDEDEGVSYPHAYLVINW